MKAKTAMTIAIKIGREKKAEIYDMFNILHNLIILSLFHSLFQWK